MKIRALSLAVTATLLTVGLGACKRSDRVSIKNEGSDTMLEVAQAWLEAYAPKHPGIDIKVSGGGSGVGLSSLIDGKVDLANSSRAIKPEELARAKERGVEPKSHHVGYDAIAIYVHKDNPIQSISLEQLAAIYGDGATIKHWSDLGVKIPGSAAPKDAADEIMVISRQNNSGTYEYFRESVLHNHDFRLGTQDLNGSNDVVQTVATTMRAIGYCGLAYATDKVKLVPVSGKDGKPVAPSVEHVLDKTYPISRPLFMYTRGEPTGATKEYLDWILSDEGQGVLMRAGYPPLRKLPG